MYVLSPAKIFCDDNRDRNCNELCSDSDNNTVNAQASSTQNSLGKVIIVIAIVTPYPYTFLLYISLLNSDSCSPVTRRGSLAVKLADVIYAVDKQISPRLGHLRRSRRIAPLQEVPVAANAH